MSLEVKIIKRFPTFTLDADFAVGNETFGFLGASGCGKSLTMRCIAGIETPDEGRIVVNGKVFFDSEQKINLTPQQRKTALLFQNYMLFPNMTVEQNICAGLDKGLTKEERAAIVEEELARFSLRGMQKRYPAQLSGGQQQRVALARMLAAKPDILMLDEPFSALDAHLKSVLEQNLISLFDSFEGTILYVSHDIDEALRFCDRIAVVDAGRIVEIDTGDDLIHRPSSLAALKLSGCKNITPAQYVDDSTAYLPAWGVTIKVPAPLPKDVTNIGFRAAAILPMPAGTHGENCFEFQVDKLSDDRFYRMMMVHFTQTDGSVEYVSDNRDEMRYLKQHVFWRVDREALPIMAAAGLRFEVGSRAVGQIPVEAIYEVTR